MFEIDSNHFTHMTNLPVIYQELTNKTQFLSLAPHFQHEPGSELNPPKAGWRNAAMQPRAECVSVLLQALPKW